MMNTLFSPLEPSPSAVAKRLLKLLIFSVGKLNVALPIESVQKVINYTPIYSSGLNYAGIAHLENREIIAIDLQKKLFGISQTVDANARYYLILAQNSAGEQFGILVAETPALSDVPASQIRALPESYRRVDTLEIASHVTMIPQPDDSSLTVFVLDVDRLVPPVS